MLTNKKLVASSSILTLTILNFALFSGCTPSGPRAVLDGAQLLRNGRPDDAVVRLQEGARLLPKNAQVWNYLGLAYHQAGKPTDAAKAYQQALALDRNLAFARFNLGCLHLDQGNAAGAVSELTTFTALQPNAPDGWTKLGVAQLRSRQLDGAERSFAQAIKLDAASPEALNGLGLVMVQRRRYPEALNQFNAAIKARTDYAPAVLNAAIVSHQNLNNRAAALQRYRDYVSLNPSASGAAAVRELVDRLEAEMRPAPRPAATNATPQGASVAQRPEPSAVKTQPPPSTNRTVVAVPPSTNAGSNASPQVLQTSPVATSAPPSRVAAPAPVTTNTPTIASTPPPKAPDVVQVPREEPIQPARDTTPVTNRTSPPEADRVKTPASVASPADLSRASQVEEPVAATSKKAKQPFIAKLNPVNWFRSRDGNERPSTPSAAERTSNPVSATSGIETSRTPDPGTRSAPPPQTGFSGPRYTYHSFPTPAAGRRAEAEKWLNDGVKARERNRPKDAVDAFRMSASADPSFFEAFYNLGVTAYEVGDRPRALIAYEQALSLNPDSMKARYNFAIVLEKAGYPQDAAEELERLLIKSPSEAAAHLTLGNLYAGYSGELEKARQHYRKFLELQPQSTQATTIRYWLEAHP